MNPELMLVEMQQLIALINFETQVAARENSLGGWLSDHTGAVQELNHELTIKIEQCKQFHLFTKP